MSTKNRLNDTKNWYALSGEQSAQQLNVVPAQGLSSTEASKRLKQYGPNMLLESKKDPRWQAFLRQYKNFEYFQENRPYDCQLIGVEFGGKELSEFTHPERAIYLPVLGPVSMEYQL